MTLITNAQMKAFLTRNRATARCTATQELWYHRTWQFGLPLGMAYLELQASIRRQRTRMHQIQAIQRAGGRYDKTAEAWYWPGSEPAEFLTRTQAFQRIQENR